MRHCSKCDGNFPKSEFYNNRGMPGGLDWWCKTCKRAGIADYKERNSRRIKEREHRRWVEATVEQRANFYISKRRYLDLMRERVRDHYGRVCTCCGESDSCFLTIDHVNGGGNEHRRTLRGKSGVQFYAWLVRQGFPIGYQTLCFNCNQAKGIYGQCPHALKKEMAIAE